MHVQLAFASRLMLKSNNYVGYRRVPVLLTSSSHAISVRSFNKSNTLTAVRMHDLSFIRMTSVLSLKMKSNFKRSSPTYAVPLLTLT